MQLCSVCSERVKRKRKVDFADEFGGIFASLLCDRDREIGFADPILLCVSCEQLLVRIRRARSKVDVLEAEFKAKYVRIQRKPFVARNEVIENVDNSRTEGLAEGRHVIATVAPPSDENAACTHVSEKVEEVCQSGAAASGDAEEITTVSLPEETSVHRVEKRAGTFKCDICFKMYSSKKLLISHAHHVHRDPSALFKCAHCSEKFKYQRSLRTHLLKAHAVDERNAAKCPRCEAVFYGSWKGSSLTLHLRDAHGEVSSALRLWDCNVCRKSFRYKSRLDEHVKVHSGEKPHVCHLCQRSFRLKQKLTNHVKTVHAKRQTAPGECGENENVRTVEFAEELEEGTFVIPGDETGTVYVRIQDFPGIEADDDIVVISIEDEDGGTFILQADVE